MQKILSKKEIKRLLPRREKDVCKNDFGHLLIIAGSPGMTGAAILCARAALRSGIGLVTVGCPKSLYSLIAAGIPELMSLPLPETKEKTLQSTAFKLIEKFISRRKVTALAIGPGLSTHPETTRLVRTLVSFLNLPIVLDADGINALQGQVESLRKAKAKIIITPHPGEFGRLIKEDKEKIQRNRVNYAKNFAKENKVVCVLKGHKTVVTNGEKIFVNPTGNPGMATAGSGDVLTGMIAGLIAQMQIPLTLNPLPRGERVRVRGDGLFNAAKIGVYLHGLAGDFAAEEKTEIGMIAGDIIEKIPEAVKTVQSS